MILIVSDTELDGHVRPVATELARRGREFVVYNPATYPSTSAVTVESTPNGISAFLKSGDTWLNLACVTGVWYRRPGDFTLSKELLPEEDKWTRTECSHQFRAIWTSGFLPHWVSDPEAIRRSSVKVTQLKLAIDMGFAVPRFTITNDIDQASKFISSCKGGAIVKVLADPAILCERRAGMVYTHLISERDMDHLNHVRYGPTFLQELIDKAMDVRVTVIGEKLFAVGIHSQHIEESRVDFRRAKIYTLSHTVITLPPKLEALCIELVSRLGLKFGAIDLVLTPDDRYVFLEINPNGQWYWLEEITGIALTKAMCDLLTTR